MKIATWNINGIRSGQEKLKDFLKKYSPDILCLQELKLDPNKKDEIDIKSYFEHYYHADKKGYSGTAIFSKTKFQELQEGVGVKEYDSEARVLVAKIGGFYIINLYFPHSRRDLSRLDFKVDFNRKVRIFVDKFPKHKTILCGDFNVAHEEIDIARPKDNRKNAGFTDIERNWMSGFLSDGWVDVFRQKYPDKQIFTWWSNMRNARARNIGWRIDYFLVSSKMFAKVNNCQILTEIYGSDHCPVMCEIK
jgi:exodeoxyribonuclease-3